MSVNLMLDPASVDETTAYLREAPAKILTAVRGGMLEAMKGLAQAAEEEFFAAGLKRRSGALLEAIEGSPKVTVSGDLVRGTVATDVGRKHVGLWLEEGIHDPAVAGNLYEFTEPDAGTIYTRGHRAFDVKPHAFLNPALQQSEGFIVETLQQAINEALPE